jgi:glycosyltransferase involved in cell wall biosynthesis
MEQISDDYEYIIIDGGSTDGSVELIKEYSERINYWVSERDKGIYHAMNKGVNNAHGDYCLFLNSGDELCDPKVIERLKNYSFQADLVSCDIYIDGFERKKLRKSVDKVNAFWLYDNSLYHPSTFIRREVLVKLPYHEDFRTISDWVFFFEALVLHDCSYQHIPMAISVFYRDGISNSSQFHEQAYSDKYKYLKNYFPAQYVDDKNTIASLHYLSSDTARMSYVGQRLMLFLFRIVAFMDIKVFKPLIHLL